MNLDLSESELAFQAEAREWLAANVPAEPLPSMDTADSFSAHQQWEATLAEARWSVVSWPERYGGLGASLVEWVIFEEEYYRAGAPGRVSQNGIFLLAPIVFDHGTPEQRDRFLPMMATGEHVWAQAWSEPEAGSDLADLEAAEHQAAEIGKAIIDKIAGEGGAMDLPRSIEITDGSGEELLYVVFWAGPKIGDGAASPVNPGTVH